MAASAGLATNTAPGPANCLHQCTAYPALHCSLCSPTCLAVGLGPGSSLAPPQPPTELTQYLEATVQQLALSTEAGDKVLLLMREVGGPGTWTCRWSTLTTTPRPSQNTKCARRSGPTHLWNTGS
ncbi:hypothetical protein HaLaN_19663 [Haematococcus lacustris]|uniref:Uncharacterized protein n=1 Tax=Haematococcus lacustris TaxID=44745 RepID=A0A699ZI00_HAELA|nr:hypothetical protein HaLaN_19663 [Haematococcus lacustris]